jgi:CBS domain-containing protein
LDFVARGAGGPWQLDASARQHNPQPRTIAPDALAAEALELISHKIQALLVVERGQVVGIVNFHDLMRIGAF